MLVLLCTMTLLSETLGSSVLEAEPGDKVTIWCHHNLYRANYIFWFKHVLKSAPLLVGCKQFTISGQMQDCYFFPKTEHFKMSVHKKNTSLTISTVDVSDTGLYYCSYIELDAIVFGNSSYIYVKEDAVSDGNETLSVLGAPKDAVFSAAFVTLTVISGVINAITIPLCVMIFVIHKQRTLRGSVTQEIEEQLSVQRDKRTKKEDDLYTCVEYQNLV